MSRERELVRGTTEYVEAEVSCSVPLTTQPVWISLDKKTWVEAEWTGTPGNVRIARAKFLPVHLTRPGLATVYVKVEDTAEVPYLRAGSVNIV